MLYLEAWDEVGNSGFLSHEFRVDTTAPKFQVNLLRLAAGPPPAPATLFRLEVTALESVKAYYKMLYWTNRSMYVCLIL